jgi:multidrug/hemolysin transport system ATP-binding protein
MNIIEVNNLTKTYGDLTAVDHISFTVERGTMLGFLGVNGAGKSTAINMLSTLLQPDDGTATICGHRLGQEDDPIRRKIGIVYQQNVLDDLLTVKENLLCRGILHGANRTEAHAQMSRLCDILKLGDILRKPYHLLSGGQKRRCEIAAALMHTPELLFLDEPTTGLDPATRKDVWEIIETLRRDENMTVFLTTHYMEEAAAADQIIILDHGKIVTGGTPFALKERYARDKLRLYGDPSQLTLEGQVTPFGMEIPLRSTMDAIPILEQVKQRIHGFEVIQGSMDDVFLNAVGKTLED